MSTEIKFENKVNLELFKNLVIGAKFMLDTQAEPHKNKVYMKVSNLYENSRDLYLKNSVNILTGSAIEITPSSKVIPVDLDITVFK
ncbi:hypothetical protein HWC29_gp074 [Aeromonas phage 4_4572]|uniref:Uncharacterized protein n=1 Tax=Aeromonas phage 4_4572 TaxID=2588517 RepID=A0A5B9N9G2_9CAUD|nr:hypothetical protein HWC29_gp074 [Aeromonas phage 4_4572]QEG09112.1 hypothetical protein [Aeromonas phage 4_4572]